MVFGADIRDSMSSVARVATEEPESIAAGDAEFVLRSYREESRRQESRRHHIGYIAIDVAHDLTLCEDGGAHVRAISLGSWQFDLDGDCAADELTADIEVAWDSLLISGPE
jgi:hypothetical protein